MAASVLDPGANQTVCESFKRCFSVCYCPLRPVDKILVGFQSQMFWGAFFQVQVLKFGVPDTGYKSSLLKEKLLLQVTLPVVGFLVRVHPNLSDLHNVGLVSFTDGKDLFSQFSGGIFSMCIYKFGIAMGGGESRVSLYCHQGIPLTIYFYYIQDRHSVTEFKCQTKLYQTIVSRNFS